MEKEAEKVYLFPETPFTNPSSFLKPAVLVSKRTIDIEGFKLYGFIDCFDEIGYPFWVAPIPYEGKTTSFYQFSFTKDVPDLAKLGLRTYQTYYGDVICLTMEKFTQLSSTHRGISIKSGMWSNVSDVYHQISAYYHLDIIKHISPTLLKNSVDIVDNLRQEFQKLYDFSVTSSLPYLYTEIYNILLFFDFIKDDECIKPDDSRYYFGSFRRPIRNYLTKCFPSLIFGDFCISPFVAKQLRSMLRFVHFSLIRFGYDCDNNISNIKIEIQKFQRDNGLPIGNATTETLQAIWENLLSSTTDPINLMLQVGLSLNLNFADERELIGEIDSDIYDEAELKFCSSLSNVVSQIKSPNCAVAKAQKALLENVKKSSKEFKELNESMQKVSDKQKNVITKAEELLNEVTQGSQKLESTLQIVDNLLRLNNEAYEEMSNLRIFMNQKTRNTNISVLLLIVMLVLVFMFFRRN
ncbi:hypothetical protein GPJ56_007011 [Histomonas meleagridis]|uniref:uncharacterized protein n=1 Tax=Histomonas meleagridis TaxID=135588 RepID=UPI00355A5813|nr:hypothetical protein GPJ56_007011 [Histomonas meleagridis]KAH0798565.1 hypothetical protein GO595_008430 [Histomonas meleagridis]